MKQIEDTKTLDMIGGIKQRSGRKKIYSSQAERQAAYRKRHAMTTLTVDLPVELVNAFNEYLKFKDVTKNDVIAKLLKTQLLRKR